MADFRTIAKRRLEVGSLKIERAKRWRACALSRDAGIM